MGFVNHGLQHGVLSRLPGGLVVQQMWLWETSRKVNHVIFVACFFLDQNMKVIPIRPKQVFAYRWKIMPEDGPTRSDPSCLTRYYYSSIKPAKDLASGLIGPLLICFKETMDQRGNQVCSLLHHGRNNWAVPIVTLG